MSAVMQEEFAMKSELARYLRVEPEDVDRAVKEDGLPCTRLLGGTKFFQRFPLRAVHAWLLDRTENAPGEMRDFESFRAGLLMSGSPKRSKTKIENSIS
jgi:hypothetical protein